jgi:hypothetical protein
MKHPDRYTRRDWTIGILAGAVFGLPLLGVGGRVAMWLVALHQGRAPHFTLDGSLAVTLMGGAAGAVIGIIFMGSRSLFPRTRWARVGLFAAVVGFVALRGIAPLTPFNVAVFLPLFVAHGIALHLWWCRVHLRALNTALA